MATNPNYSSIDGPTNSTQPTKSVNRQGVYVPRSRNTFDLSYFHYKTQRFGQYEPFFVMEGVPGDKIPLSSSHEVRSMPMVSPFLSSLKLNKDYFQVPMQAILPNTWELIYKNPSQGDDVPDDCNCLFPLFNINGNDDVNSNILSYLWSVFVNPSVTSIEVKLSVLFSLELFLSSGSLLSNLGYHLNPVLYKNGDRKITFDQFFDRYCNQISLISFTYNGILYHTGINSDTRTLTNSQAIDFLREHLEDVLNLSVTFKPNPTDWSGYTWFFLSRSVDTDTNYVNISRVLAYQMCCSQFYVNPQVDYIYNAQLWRDNFLGALKYVDAAGSSFAHDSLVTSTQTFTYNGLSVRYDYLSLHWFKWMLLTFITEGTRAISETNNAYPYFTRYYALLRYLFGYQRTLKFGDYFTDCRTRPYAIGSMDSPVVGNKVSSIDVTKSIVMQRFLNSVVKLGNNFGDYLRGIFGETPSPDYHVPHFIAHQDFDIGGFETAGTTKDNLGSLGSNLMSGDDKYCFEVDIDMPCILIGISYFQLPRVYSQTKDRHFFHYDRFDMFNPMLQYIGDQPVYNVERTDSRSSQQVFGYQSRNGEYKQRYSVADGGFVGYLPSWSFIADFQLEYGSDVEYVANQSPDFIRCQPSDFDRYFSALSGYSLSSAFHFIVVYNNKCVCSRPMEVNPNIL